MRHFKHFLENQGAALAATGTFLPFYALPYITTPEQHPSFKGLFEPEWAAGQRSSLKTYLESMPGQQAGS